MAEYIERDMFLRWVHEFRTDDKGLVSAVINAPAKDVVPVVRCKDCKFCEDQGLSGLYCNHPDNRNPCGCRPNDFCNDGERKEANP